MASAHQGQLVGSVSKRGLELFDQVDYRLAESEADRDAIYRLRYRAYLKEGAVAPNPSERVHDRYDDLPNSWVFGVHLNGKLASSLRITVATPEYRDCPSMGVFADLLGPELDNGKVVIDPTRFVAEPAQANHPELPYITLRLAFVACAYFNADLGLATVRTEHQAFYRRLFMHRSISEPRDYPGLKKPIVMMAVDFPAMRDRVFARYPFLRSTLFERRMLFERSVGPTLRRTEAPSTVPTNSAECYI